jgi:hypothetical protein
MWRISTVQYWCRRYAAKGIGFVSFAFAGGPLRPESLRFSARMRPYPPRGHPAMSLALRRKQARHAVPGEPRGLPIERARGGTGLLGTLRRGMAEEDNRTNQRIRELLEELRQQS